jgi:hypothetical protein
MNIYQQESHDNKLFIFKVGSQFSFIDLKNIVPNLLYKSSLKDVTIVYSCHII